MKEQHGLLEGRRRYGGQFSCPVFLFVCFFRAALVAYGRSQARGSNWSCGCGLGQILNSLSEARDGTYILTDISLVPYC